MLVKLLCYQFSVHMNVSSIFQLKVMLTSQLVELVEFRFLLLKTIFDIFMSRKNTIINYSSRHNLKFFIKVNIKLKSFNFFLSLHNTDRL